MTLPAELTMGVIGLYGLYFAAVGWDLSNRRKKRSLQGNSKIKAEKIKKDSLDSIPSNSISVKIQIWVE